jgi:hypothetical protein
LPSTILPHIILSFNAPTHYLVIQCTYTLSCHSMHLHILSFNAPTHYLVIQCTYTLSCHSVHLHIILSFIVPTNYLVIQCVYTLSCHSMHLHIILSFNAPTHSLSFNAPTKKTIISVQELACCTLRSTRQLLICSWMLFATAGRARCTSTDSGFLPFYFIMFCPFF